MNISQPQKIRASKRWKAGFIALLTVSTIPMASAVEYLYPTLEAAYESLSFNPNDKGSAVFVATADVHYGLNDSQGVLPMIREVNAMSPRPAFFTIVGDMITSASPSFGVMPSATGRAQAINEFNLLKEDLTQLDTAIPIHLALGNHDQAPGRGDPDMFWEVFPGHPVLETFDVAGVAVIKLNGYGDGYIDDAQKTWLNNEVAKLDVDATVLVLVHQPGLGAVVNERGIAMAISEAFANHTGPIWLVAGHHHANRTHVYQLPHTTIVQAAICNAGTGYWGSEEAPGYWIFCIRDGQIAGRIFRKIDTGFRVEPAPDTAKARPLPLPWKEVSGTVWTLFVGHSDDPYYVSHEGGRKVDTFWYNVKELTYRLPRAAAPGSVTRAGILAAIPSKILADQQFFLSADGINWTLIANPDQSVKSHYVLDIPPDLQQKEIYVRLVNPTTTTIIVGGFALLE